ncbi:uncharacterized protein METZ01_LOCUS183668 [marine metagenome]|uniref:Uncharacterized protein n=1 Tax=marine metagenome TaxID=408172 RepID=A0A382CYD4_9ZZZZ
MGVGRLLSTLIRPGAVMINSGRKGKPGTSNDGVANNRATRVIGGNELVIHQRQVTRIVALAWQGLSELQSSCRSFPENGQVTSRGITIVNFGNRINNPIVRLNQPARVICYRSAVEAVIIFIQLKMINTV